MYGVLVGVVVGCSGCALSARRLLWGCGALRMRVSWRGGSRVGGRVTVFATYAAAGLGVLERAHAAGAGRWDLMVVDEAHRTAGVLGKPWAVVHDDRRLPAVRRLYMTATPRLWEVPGQEGAPMGRGSWWRRWTMRRSSGRWCTG